MSWVARCRGFLQYFACGPLDFLCGHPKPLSSDYAIGKVVMETLF